MLSTAKQLPQTDVLWDVANIPTHTELALLQIKKQNRLPLLNCEICFSDNVWDFSANKKVNVSDTKFKIQFRDVPAFYSDAVKFYAFIELSRGKIKVQTVYENVKRIIHFLKHQFSVGYIAPEDISLSAIECYFEQLPSLKACSSAATILRRFFVEYSTFIHPCVLDPEIIHYLQQQTRNPALRAAAENAKLPDIPQDYFNKLLDITLRVIKSGDPEDKKYHHIANLLLLLMQTGLRIGELCALTTDCMRVIILNSKRLVYLEYPTWKRERGTNVMSKENMFANELTEFAFNNLVNELKDARKKTGTNYLFVDPYKQQKYPVSGEEFSAKYLKRYYLYIDKYMGMTNLDENAYPELSRSRVSSFMGPQKKYNDMYIVHPVTEQYRVHVCSELYARGVSLEYIAKYMGHLSHTMRGYYVRCKKDNQENTIFSRIILSDIISGKIEPLGGKGSLLQKINEFIEANNLNVSTDMDQIVDELMKRVPIRQKAGGVCIKSSMLRDCSVDAETNEFYCAYNVCPNVYHFFYMADYTYQQAVNLRHSIEINTNHGFLRQAEKERNMLHTIVKQKLIPELESLQKHIELDGRESILCRYPNLSAIIEKFDNIYEGAVNWIKNEP